jgi:hypothetical protein
MAVSPPDIRLAGVFGGAVFQSVALPGPASYDATGQRYVFIACPDDRQIWRYALDVEDKTGQADPALSAVLQKIMPDMPALQAWTVVECLAKLSDLPAHLMLRQFQSVNAGPLLQKLGAEIAHIPATAHYITIARIACNTL